MSYDLAEVVIPAFEQHFPTIRAELDGLDLAKDFYPWPQTDGYSGVWSVYGLFFPDKPYLPVDVEGNRRRCPRTSKLLDSMPRLVAAGFSQVGPKSHIFKHTDNYAPNLLRLHLGVRVPKGCTMWVKGAPVVWFEGRCVQFSGQDEHEVINSSDEARVVLLADFRVHD
ncbi:MAG TPA: aspartyl/asparaginyl beta-hydroxylase domain-containing protein [Planctomycetota bacterium]|nr:aspartyl/asparaginyl beta-hydroxylase domain-containing protein [Planctomycetota bacterium]